MRRLLLGGVGLLAALMAVLAWLPLAGYGEGVHAVELDRDRASHTRACTMRDDCTLVVGAGDLAMQILVTLGAALILAGALTDGYGMRAGGALLLAAWAAPVLVLATVATDARDVREALVHGAPLLVVFGVPGALAMAARGWARDATRAA